MQVKSKDFHKTALRYLRDEQIQHSLHHLDHFNDARTAATAEVGAAAWERLRDRAREIKKHSLENLDYYLDMLERNVTRNGGKVHFARDAQEATDIVVELARSRNVRRVTKGKSMVSEEMGVNAALQQMGVEVTETDLGEYIIQLAGERPFHIVAPAVHKSKEQVAQLFVEKAGMPHYSKIDELTQGARHVLRQKFLGADMGITGANFAVAETGTIAVFTNEGNGRMCTSLPRIHVAVMGMEKVIPALEDLGVFIRLLPRAATGQRITSYVTLVSGPRRRRDEDGPQEFHLIILDNGRTRVLQDPELREALYCIRCSACLNVCPVYRKIGGHAYGWVYSGPIGAVVTPALVGLDKAAPLPFASTLCGACRDVCPLKIDIPRMLLTLRSRAVQGTHDGGHASLGERLLVRQAWFRAVRSRFSFELDTAIVSLLQMPFVRKGWIRRMPFPPLSRWTRGRDLPALARKPFRRRWRDMEK